MTNTMTGESRGTVCGTSRTFNVLHRVKALYVRAEEYLAGRKSRVLILCTVADVIRSYCQNRFINLVRNEKRNFAGNRVLS